MIIAAKNIDPKQFGGKKGHGTEHMIVALMDRVLMLLDNNNTLNPIWRSPWKSKR